MIRVIACGNPDAGDDAVALAVAEAVRGRLGRSSGVDVVVVGAAINAVPAIENATAAILVDAVRTRGGRPAGEIVRVEAGPEGLPVDLAGRVSSHGFGVGEAVAVARALGCSAPIVVIGVEAGDVSLGRELSPAVGAAVARATDVVVGEVLARRLPA